DPASWSEYDTVLKAKEKNGFDGIGYVFSENDGLVGIDLDNCFDDQGNLQASAWDIVKRISSYTEYSPSKNGLNIILKGEICFS
ncbi:MAG: hypothetical protein ACOCZW_04915, partial [Bacteroidota bacterium]